MRLIEGIYPDFKFASVQHFDAISSDIIDLCGYSMKPAIFWEGHRQLLELDGLKPRLVVPRAEGIRMVEGMPDYLIKVTDDEIGKIFSCPKKSRPDWYSTFCVAYLKVYPGGKYVNQAIQEPTGHCSTVDYDQFMSALTNKEQWAIDFKAKHKKGWKENPLGAIRSLAKVTDGWNDVARYTDVFGVSKSTYYTQKSSDGTKRTREKKECRT